MCTLLFPVWAPADGRGVALQARATDANSDGFVDQVDLSVSVATSANGQTEGVRRVVVVAFFDYRLHGEAKLDMDSLAIIDASSALPASSLTVSGDLVFQQRSNVRVLEGCVCVPLFLCLL